MNKTNTVHIYFYITGNPQASSQAHERFGTGCRMVLTGWNGLMNKMDGLKQLQLAAGQERGFMLLSSVLLSNLHRVTKVNYQFSSTDGWDLAEWFERLTAKVNVATESWVQSQQPPAQWNLEGKRRMLQFWMKYMENLRYSPFPGCCGVGSGEGKLTKKSKKQRKNFTFQELGWRLLFRFWSPSKRSGKRYKTFLKINFPDF